MRPLREAMEAEGKLEVGNWHRKGGRDRAWYINKLSTGLLQ